MSLLSISLLWPACVAFNISVWNGLAPLATSKLALEVGFLWSGVTFSSWGWESLWLAGWDKLVSLALVGGSGSDGDSSDVL